MPIILALAALVATQQATTPPCLAHDTADVSTFITRFMATLPAPERVPRAAFVLVCGDRITLTRGFGRAASGAVIDPERTLFRAASNSKLVAATAAVQMAAEGKWKLTDDVNRYLPPAARLDAGFGGPVTIADLLTHTSGIEEKFAGGLAQMSERSTLAEFFVRHKPMRVRPAGVEVSYSNVGMALAGYAVEAASGEHFEDYAAHHIFTPLGMMHSTFAQPIPAAWLKDLASAPPRAARDIAFVPYPAASLVSTPADMGRFIAAHLSGGGTDAARILPRAFADDMHATHWRAQPSVPGVAYGFFEGEINGRHILFHTGDSGDHSVVLLIPAEGVGIYFVYSGTDEQATLRERLVKELTNRYYPAPPQSAPAFAAQHVEQYAGTYRGAAYSHSNYEKLKAMFYQVRVRAASNGALEIMPPGGGLVHLTAVAPLVFNGDSGEVVAFRTDSAGAVTGFTLSGSIWDPQSFDRIGLLADGRVHLAAFVFVALTLVARVLFAPFAILGRRMRRMPKPQLSNAERKWWRWSGIVCALTLLTPVIGVGVAMLSFRPGAVAIPRAAFVVGVWLGIMCLAGLCLTPGAVALWRENRLSLARRITLTLVAAAFVLGTPLLLYWKVIPV